MFNFDYFPYILYSLVSPVIFIIIVVGIVVFFINRNRSINNMDPNQIKPKASAKDFFLNLGAFTALYTLVGSLLSLLFNVINTAYPQITNGYNYSGGSQSISWPVAILVVLFPIFVLLMWFLEREYRVEPERQSSFTHRGFTYITLFVAGLAIAGDLITVIYFFIDGQELTTGFLLKVLVLLIVASGIFIYFISDLRNKLTSKSRKIWRIISGLLILASIIWGFSVLGSPRTQRLYKYDEQKVNDLSNINNQIINYYTNKGILPNTLEEMAKGNYYIAQVDPQTEKPYEYEKISNTEYNLCAEFNKASDDKNTSDPYRGLYSYNSLSWTHPADEYCFKQTVNPNPYNPNIYPKPVPMY